MCLLLQEARELCTLRFLPPPFIFLRLSSAHVCGSLHSGRRKSVRDITIKLECDIKEFISPVVAPGEHFPYAASFHFFPPPSTPPAPPPFLFSIAPPPLPLPLPSVSSSSSSTRVLDVNSPIISHWPRRGSGGVSSTGVDVYIYTLYGARFQPTAVTHKAKKRSHFLAPLRKQRKDHGSNWVVQPGSWTLNHNKHFFLTRPCSENSGVVVAGWVECWSRPRGDG